MRNARRLLAALLAVVMLLPSILVPGLAAETGFKDVRDGSWYEEAVSYVSEAGFMTGTSKNTFSPNEEITRAMFVTILARFAKAEADNAVSVFDDVAPGKYYTAAVAWAAEKGIVFGADAHHFAPHKSITRQEICAMVARFVKVMGYQLPAAQSRSFTDAARISAYAAKDVAYVASVGLASGYTDGSFRPRQTATRAEIATMIMRLDQLVHSQTVDPEPIPVPAQDPDPVQDPDANPVPGSDTETPVISVPDASRPAQSFADKAGAISVSVAAPEGALPENTSMKLAPVTDLTAISAKVGGEVLGAVDISFAKDGVELEPEQKVKVQISMDALKTTKNPAVVHIKDDGSFEYVASNVIATRGKADAIEFEADSFSVYAIIDGSGDDARLIVNFHIPTYNTDGTLAGETVETVYVTRRDVINTDGEGGAAVNYLPTIIPDYAVDRPNENAPRFFGWSFTDEYTKDDVDGSHDINYVRNYVKTFLENNTIVDCSKEQTINVYPMMFYFYTVSYKNELGDSTLNVAPVYSKTQNPSYTVYYMYEPQTVGYAFDTWLDTSNGENYSNGREITLTSNLVLCAKLKEGYYIIFDEQPGSRSLYKGAKYVAPVWCENGVVPAGTSALVSSVKGYNFGGWYLENQYQEGSGDAPDTWSGSAYTFPSKITENVNLVAKWNRGTATYTVLIEVQDPTDDPDAANSEKHYIYYKSVNGTATTGTSTTLPSNYTTPSQMIGENLGSYRYFSYNAANSTVTQKVAGDGSTVFRVRFDREKVTYNAYAKYSTGFTYSGIPSTSTFPLPSTSSSYCYYNTHMQHYGYNATTGEYFPLTLEAKSGYSADTNGNIRNDRCKWIKEDGTEYTATYSYYNTPSTNIFVATSTRSSMGTLQFSCTGLYGAKMKEGEWKHSCTTPYEHWFFYDLDSGWEVFIPSLSTYTYFPSSQQQTTLNLWLRYDRPSSDQLPIKFYYQDIEGHYPSEPDDTATVAKGYGQHFYETVEGFRCEKLTIGTSSYTPPTFVNGQAVIQYASGSSSGNTYYVSYNTTNTAIYYSRNQHTLKFYVDGVEKKTVENIYYDAPLSSYSYTPTLAPTEYFVQWYADETCKVPFDFENATMPDTDLAIYTKLETKGYRVFLHVNMEGVEENNYEWPTIASGSHAGDDVVAWTDSDQAKNFRINYGVAITNGQPIQGTAIDADGNTYAIAGWYTDPACTQAFDFRNVLTDANTYAYPKTEPTDPADATHDAPYNKDAEANRVWITGKLDLYAKWRQLIPGATGVDVVYDAYENNTDRTGHFSGDEQYFYDNLHYADGATAFAEAGSTPYNSGLQFKSWEIMKWENEQLTGTKEYVYPGGDFNVFASYAQKEKASQTHIHRITLVPAREANCINDGHAAYYWCSLCCKYFSDAEGNTEITPEIIQANGNHQFSAYVSADEDGVAGTNGHYRVCSVCGTHESETLIAHTYSDVVTDPTETEQGYTTHTCTACGHTYVDSYVDATGRHFTVSFSVPTGVTAVESITCVEGQSITLPTAEAPQGYNFIGWIVDEVNNVTTRPSGILRTSKSYTPTADITLRAIYRYRSGTGETVYALVDDELTDWSGNYVISYSNDSSAMYFMKGLAGNGTSYETASNGGAVAYADADITLTDNKLYNVGADYVFTIAPSGDYYTVQSQAQSTYLAITNSYLRAVTSGTATTSKWSFDVSSPSVRFTNAAGGNYKYIGFDSNNCFVAGTNGYYSTYIWKETTDGTVYYTTVIGNGGNAATEPVEVQEITEPVKAEEVEASRGQVVEPEVVPEPVAEPNAVTNPDPVTATKTVWAPTTEINTTDEYLIGIKNGSTVYLLANHNGSNYYYTYTYDYSYYNYYMYLSVATIEDGYVTAATGAQSNLEYCKWKFGTAGTGGVITNQYDTSKKLYSSTYGDLYQTTSGASWTYSATSGTLRSGSYYVYQGTISGSPYAGVTSTQQSNNIVLYKKTTINTGYTVSAAVNNSSYGSVAPASATVEENQSTSFTVTPNTGYAIGSVSVNPSTAATASFSGNTVTVSGVTADCTVTVNLVRTYTVTFKDWDGTVLKTETVASGGSATAPTAPARPGYRFTGWDVAFTNVTSNLTVTAQYSEKTTYEVKFVMPDLTQIGSTVTVPTTGVQLVSAPTERPTMAGAGTISYNFIGWEVNGAPVDVYDYPITDDTTFVARFEQIDSTKQYYDYTFYLRAVYEEKIDPKLTHVTWYANNGTGASNNSADVQINSGIDIAAYDMFSNEGYTFLGWARMPEYSKMAAAGRTYNHEETQTSEALGYKITEYTDLTANDLWLVWNDNGDGTGYYTVRENGTELNNGAHFTQIAANERTPYHGLYAVWKHDVFYVYHSSSGMLQAFEVPISTASSGSVIGTFDITGLVSDGCLYGGYYKTYGGVNMPELEAAAAGFTAVGSGGWTAGTLDPDWKEVAELNTANIAAVNFDKYDGSSLKSTKNTNTRFWTKADAYNVNNLPAGMTAKDVNGETMKPVANTIYYLKEVPNSYLPNKLAFIKATKDTTLLDDAHTPIEKGKISSLYLLTAVDDRYYSENGFFVSLSTTTDNNVGAPEDGYDRKADVVARMFTIAIKDDADGSRTYKAKTLNRSIPGDPDAQVGFVAAKHLDYTWITNHRTEGNGATFYLKPYWTTLDGVTVQKDNILAFNINSDGTEISKVENP